jgi:hypothetical protein
MAGHASLLDDLLLDDPPRADEARSANRWNKGLMSARYKTRLAENPEPVAISRGLSPRL